MNWKCFFLGHRTSTWNVVSEAQGTYESTCGRCGRVDFNQSHELVGIAMMNKRDTMRNMAWQMLENTIPDTFHKEAGKTKHILTDEPSGKIVFTIDLGEHPLKVLEIYKENLCKLEPDFAKWNIRPLLKIVKD